MRDKGHEAGDTGLAMDFSSTEIIRWKFSVVQEIRQQKSALRCCVINYGLKSAARMTYFALMEASSEKSQKGLSEHSLGISKTLPYSKPNFFLIHTTLNLQLSTHNPKTTVNEPQWCKKKVSLWLLAFLFLEGKNFTSHAKFGRAKAWQQSERENRKLGFGWLNLKKG
ncbi:MAG: hypothetical protein LM632_04435 [Armatimonadetes bacterium]|nr:hypothetical protein [Armatimonadota bacterium]